MFARQKKELSVIIMFLVCCINVSGQEMPSPADDFYGKYPVFQRLFPFGVYGGVVNVGYTSENLYYMDEERGYQFIMEGLRGNYVNFIWHGTFHNHFKKQANGKYELDKLAYLKLEWLKKLDMYIFPNFQYWFEVKHGLETSVFKEYKGKNTYLTDLQLDEVIEKYRPKFEAVQILEKTYGDRLLGIVNDDEPGGYIKTNLSSMRAIKRFLPHLPVTVVHNQGPPFQKIVPYTELVCSEAYYKFRLWQTRDEFLEAYRKSPNTICWNTINTGSWNVEYTLPWLPDDRFSQELVRLSFWQSVAGGAKGFMCYGERLRPAWWPGGESPHHRNQLGREVKGNTLSAMKEFGRDITAIGTLLLSCYPKEEDIKSIRFKCNTMDNVIYRGPVLDCGVLLDKKNRDLRYIVVYNNNTDAEEAGNMVLPEEWFTEKFLYDLHTLQRLSPLEGTNVFKIETLRPGDGRIYLIGDVKNYVRCKDKILINRTCNELIRLDIQMRELTAFPNGPYKNHNYIKELDSKLGDIQENIGKVKTGLKGKNIRPERLYESIGTLLERTERIKTTGKLGEANRKFCQLEDMIIELDEMIACFMYELFGIRRGDRATHVNNKIKKNQQLMADYRNLMERYFCCKNIWWKGLLSSELTYRLNNSIAKGQELINTYKESINSALEVQRRPIKLLFITPERHADEYFLTYAWLYKNFVASYARITANGMIVTWEGKNLSPEDFKLYDVLWFHRTRPWRCAQEKEKKPAIEAVFEPGLLNKEFVDGIHEYIRQEKGLLLTGLFALYTIPLGYERQMPNVFHDEKTPTIALLQGFCAEEGFENHPVFNGYNDKAPLVDIKNYVKILGPRPDLLAWDPRGKGTELRFDPKGFYTSGHMHERFFYAECTWQYRELKGRVIAGVYDSTLGPLDGYAGIVEYGKDKGKVLVSGAMPFDLSPGTCSYPQFSFFWRYYIRGLAYNMICYLHSEGTYKKQVSSSYKKIKEKVFTYLPVKWRFKLDPEDKGKELGWSKKDFDDRGWKDINIGVSWESQGYDYDGYAWYRTKFRIAEEFRGKKIYLHFGAVDEVGHVYLDGEYIGKVGATPKEDKRGWAKPYKLEITDKISDFTREYQLSVQVHDSLAAGGIWKPVSIIGAQDNFCRKQMQESAEPSTE